MVKTRHLLFILVLLFVVPVHAQVTSDPPLPTAGAPVTITFDATLGSGNLAGYTGDVYTHTGVYIHNDTHWRYVIGNWGDNSVQPKLTRVGDDLYELRIEPSIRTFYGVADGETITSMNFVFRAASGSPQSEDLFVEVVEEGLTVSLLSPAQLHPVYAPNDTVRIEASANEADSIALHINDKYISSTTSNSLSADWRTDDHGQQHIVATAYGADNTTATASTTIFVRGEPEVRPLPDGVVNGINYIDNNTVTLVLHDPPALKDFVFVIGDMNDWTLTEEHFMHRTPDGTHFWVTVGGLEADAEYAFQYYIDGTLRLADPYTHKVLDPWNDPYIDEYTYPGLKAYPAGRTVGQASIMHPGRTPYQWEVTNFTPPPAEDMVIYELLIRDFVETSAIKTVKDSLDYLQRLGVNVIQLMPVNQFEGNISWGYNPSFYFATDKAYGTREDYKRFIDECHRRGIAVVLDIVLNHSFNLSPLVQMYFDPDAGPWGKPLPENPWYLTDCPHEPWCWGNTFDQNSPYTRELFKRIVQYWITEFNIDGYRFDFTKGFTNQQTGGQGWNYDPARIANIKRIATQVRDVKDDAIIILEHFTDNREEKELAADGMLLWGNVTYNYQEAAMGWLNQSNFSWISHQERGWDQPHLIGYMESHDEERIMYKNLTYGNDTNLLHDIRDLETALRRAELVAAFYFTIPGPKMIWQFGELGYDYSINHCPDGTIDSGCRTSPKPIRWDYYDDERRKRLYTVYSMLTHLKQSYDVFRTSDYTLSLVGAMKRIHLNHPSGKVTVLGNFGVEANDIDPHFQQGGRWYEFFTKETLEVKDVNSPLRLKPGEYRLYSTIPFAVEGIMPADETFHIYPNPAHNTVTITAAAAISELTFFDLTGRKVISKTPGQTSVTLHTDHLSQGIYVVRVRADGKTMSKRVQVIN